MFIGYAQNHIGDRHRMLNLHIKGVVLTCDVIWTTKKYDEYISI